jgi:hypothetical protein
MTTPTTPDGRADRRCPICGRGTLADIDFGGEDLVQDPTSEQVDVYTCGHEVERARLDSADPERLDVERRTSDETAEPTPRSGDR